MVFTVNNLKMRKLKFFLFCFAVCFVGLALLHLFIAVVYGEGSFIENIMNIKYIVLLVIALFISVLLTLLLTNPPDEREISMRSKINERNQHIKRINNTKQKSRHFRVRTFALAGAEGLEPSARGFGDRCSTN